MKACDENRALIWIAPRWICTHIFPPLNWNSLKTFFYKVIRSKYASLDWHFQVRDTYKECINCLAVVWTLKLITGRNRTKPNVNDPKSHNNSSSEQKRKAEKYSILLSKHLNSVLRILSRSVTRFQNGKKEPGRHVTLFWKEKTK